MGYAPGSTMLPCVTVFIIAQNSLFDGKWNVLIHYIGNTAKEQSFRVSFRTLWSIW